MFCLLSVFTHLAVSACWWNLQTWGSSQEVSRKHRSPWSPRGQSWRRDTQREKHQNAENVCVDQMIWKQRERECVLCGVIWREGHLRMYFVWLFVSMIWDWSLKLCWQMRSTGPFAVELPTQRSLTVSSVIWSEAFVWIIILFLFCAMWILFIYKPSVVHVALIHPNLDWQENWNTERWRPAVSPGGACAPCVEAAGRVWIQPVALCRTASHKNPK